MSEPTPQTFVAVVGEDGRYSRVRRRAIERAREEGARLLLFDVDAGRSILENPLPTDWSGAGTQEQFGDALDPNDLVAAGREPLARQVDEARQAGVEAWGWLPNRATSGSLAEYAETQGVTLVLVPEEETEIASEVRAPVEVVDRETRS